jgi:Ca-activated chloride channel homolog
VNEPVLPFIEKLQQERTREPGTLEVSRDGQRVGLPLTAHRIIAKAADRVAQVTVEQSFQNPFQEFLEAVYIFPMGGGAAVSVFEMKVGDRTLKGVVKERGQARKDYRKAVDDGRRAALLEQDRDNVFTVQVGNLPPGEAVSVRIVYSERLSYFEDGTTELRLPLVVAPRYIPGEPLDGVSAGDGVEPDTDSVPDASRITPPRLAPGFDPKVALSIDVELADGSVSDIACSQHAIKVSNGHITLSREDEPLNRDFVLRWRLAKTVVQSRLLVNRDGCGMLSLVAPRREGFLGTPRDVVFLLDRSGSMRGVKMASAARACSILLATLGPRDKFAVCAFSDSTEWMNWTTADEAGIAVGQKFLRGIDAGGGTVLDPALKDTMAQFKNRPEMTGREAVLVIITDGQIGNEAQVLKRIQADRIGVRIFTVGIDTAVNDAFLQRLSALGGGTCTLCVPGEALEQALSSVGREIGAPVITEIQIDGADQLAPSHTPDLFSGRAATSFVVGQKLNGVGVRGKFADGTTFKVNVKAEEIELPAITHLWARARSADLEDQFRLGKDVKQEIVDLAIKHTLLTRFTAFVVIDESEIVNGKGGHRTVVQPVEMPERWVLDSIDSSVAPSMLSRNVTFLSQKRMPDMDSAGKTGAKLTGASSKLGSSATGKDSAARLFSTLYGALGGGRSPKPMPQGVLELAKLIEEYGAQIDAGKIPPVEPIELARQVVLRALAHRDSANSSRGVQKFLRSTLVEFIAALASGSSASLRPIFDRVQKELDRLIRKDNFWEASV